jgi:hypothetical protein
MPDVTLDHDAFQRLYPVEYYKQFLSQNIRPDGRAKLELRNTSVMVNTIGTAHSSASVQLGETFVVAGIQLDLCTPSKDTHDRGKISIQVLQKQASYLRPGTFNTLRARLCLKEQSRGGLAIQTRQIVGRDNFSSSREYSLIRG